VYRNVLDMTVASLVAVVAPHTGKIIKNGLNVFERGENLQRNGILHFVFRLSQSSESALKVYLDEKLTFLKRAWH